jgi:hypothetical protein
MDVCVCLAGADGPQVSRVRIPGRMASHGCCVVCVSCRPEKGELRRGEGGRGWPGKVPRSPAAPPKEKGKKLVDRKVPDRPIWLKGKAIKKKKKKT